jgi:uncharacterized coiled-coil protein SlyX
MMFDFQLLRTAAFTPASLQPPNAWVGHLPFADWIMRQVRPEVFVELGTHTGNSYFSFCQSVAENDLATRCFAVDTWDGDEHSLQYSEDVFVQVAAGNERYAGFSRLLRMTFDEASASFADQSIGLLHIDGLHTYEAVSHDFETWLPRLKPGAVVLFHDTNVRENNFGVWKLWEELGRRYPRRLEFFHSHGLGVLQIPGGEVDLDWLNPGFAGRQGLTDYFAALGAAQLDRFALKQTRETLQTRDAELAAAHVRMGDMHTDMNAYIDRLKDQLAGQEKRCGEVEEELAAAYVRMGDMHADMNAYIDRLKAQLADEEQRRGKVETQLAGEEKRRREVETQLAEAHVSMGDMNANIDRLKEKGEHLRASIDAMLASSSWRLTGPLRWAGSALKRGSAGS